MKSRKLDEAVLRRLQGTAEENNDPKDATDSAPVESDSEDDEDENGGTITDVGFLSTTHFSIESLD